MSEQELKRFETELCELVILILEERRAGEGDITKTASYMLNDLENRFSCYMEKEHFVKFSHYKHAPKRYYVPYECRKMADEIIKAREFYLSFQLRTFLKPV